MGIKYKISITFEETIFEKNIVLDLSYYNLKLRPSNESYKS